MSNRIGKYELLEEIGRGGFAVVYKARDTTLDRIVALKVLHTQLLVDPRFVARFYQEAQTAARLSHPNIVIIHDVGEEAGQPYLAMAYLPGRTLDVRLRSGALPVEQALSLIQQIASALDTIHASGLVHRDIKPGNIMVADYGHATLLDFGIVRAAEGTHLTTSMTVLGTPEYMAPEQAEVDETREIDWRADLYALGVVAYEMLVGRPPFIGTSPTAVLYKHVHEPPPAPTSLKPDLMPGLEPVLLRALAKQRELRYQSAGDFAAALRQAYEETVQQERAAVQPPVPIQPQSHARAPKRVGTTPRSRVWIRWAVGAGMLVLIAVCACIGFGPLRGLIFRATVTPAPPTTVRPRQPTDTPFISQATETPEKTATVKPQRPTDTPPPSTKTPFEVLPLPVKERTTSAGTWRVFSNGNYVSDLVFRDGLLWAATSGGVVVWDPENGDYAKYTTLDGLVCNGVTAAAVGSDGTLWFGTWCSGVSRYDPVAQTWRTYTTADGLADDDVRVITVGADGDVWFATYDSGVS